MLTKTSFEQWRSSRKCSLDFPVDGLTLSRLRLRWEVQPEPCHDFRQFLKRSRDGVLVGCASSSCYSDQVTEIWDVQERLLLDRFSSPGTQTSCMDWLSDHTAYVTGGHDTTLTAWREGQRVGQ